MRKGKGVITKGQYRHLYEHERRTNVRLMNEIQRLNNQLHSMTVAHNKLLAEKKQLEANPNVKKMVDLLKVASSIPSTYI